MRWRVRYSTRSATWFYACETVFVDADTAAGAKTLVEGLAEPGVSHEVWGISPATERMEQAHIELKAKQAAWREAVRRGDNPRGIL